MLEDCDLQWNDIEFEVKFFVRGCTGQLSELSFRLCTAPKLDSGGLDCELRALRYSALLIAMPNV